MNPDGFIGIIKNKYRNNQKVVNNIIGTFVVKGLSLCLSLFTMPAYIRYFDDKTVLGVWYTIVSIISWVNFFDLGLGNGLRNLLPGALEGNKKKEIKELISTTYVMMIILVLIISTILFSVIPLINWNAFLNVDPSLVENKILTKCVMIVLAGLLLQFIVKLIDSILYALQKSAIVNFLVFSSTLLIVIALYVAPRTSITENLVRMSWMNVIAMLIPYVIASGFVFKVCLRGLYPSFGSFRKEYIKPLMEIGVTLLFLQFVFMVVSSTNEYFISRFTDPGNVVEYQAYNKIFKTGAMVVSLSLIPIWSAVTKELVNKNYSWIKKTYKLFLLCGVLCFLVELTFIPFLQPIMNIWLGKDYIQINYFYALVFAFSGSMFVFHYVNSTIGNGMSYFRVQVIWMGFAAAIYIPLSYCLVQVTGSWIGVILASILAICPYEILAPFYTFRKLNSELIEADQKRQENE